VNIRQVWRRKQNANILFIALQIVLDMVLTCAAFYLSYRLRLLTKHEDVGPFGAYAGMLAIQLAVMLVVFASARLYAVPRARSRVDEGLSIFMAVVVAVLMTLGVTSLAYKDFLNYPRLMMVYDVFLTSALVVTGRLFHNALVWNLRAAGMGVERVLIIGTTEIGRMIHQKTVHSPGLGYRVVGYVAEKDSDVKTVFGAPVLGKIDDITNTLTCNLVDQVIVALPEASRLEILDIVSQCEQGKVSVKVFPDVFQIMASEISIGVLEGVPLLTIRDPAMQGWQLAVKRAMDIVVSAIGLVILSPFMLFMAVLIKLESPGPAFYFQERMGLDARPFPMIKFRSMRQDAEKQGPGWTTANDPRRTRLGSLIRRLSIDEFPQLINVLLGDMSLVGPRPERPIYVEQFRRSIPRYMDRHRERAGLTGWAQVNGLRGDTSIAERTKYDLWYVENWSIFLDIKILIRTALKIFTDRQAY
jgi:exopolysaccharide biosynthesis polyprenyl glycosylphosphotransferase